MADSDVIRATTSVDTSGLKAGMDEASSVTRASLAILQEQYRTASADVRQSVNRIVDAEKQAAQQISEGHQRVAAALQAAANTERTALDGLIAKQDGLKASISEMTASLNGEAAVATEASAAVETLGAAHTHVVSEVQAASGAIRVFEGAMPIRAVERFSVSVLGLGPILQAAFPIVGAVALGEIIVRTWERLDPLIKAEKELDEVTKKVDEDFARLAKEFEQLKIKELTDEFGKLSGAKLAYSFKTLDTAQDEAALESLKEKIEIAKQQVLKPAERQLAAAQVLNTIGGGLEILAVEQGKRAVAAAQDQILGLESKAEVLAEKIRVDAESATKSLADAGKADAQDKARAARQGLAEEKAAASQRIQDLRASEQDALDTLKASHQVTVAEELSFWERMKASDQEQSAEATGVIKKLLDERVHAINNTLGNLYQEQDRVVARGEAEDLRIREEAERAGEAQSKRLFEAQKKAVDDQALAWEAGGKRTLQSTITYWQGIASTYRANAAIVEEALRKATEAEQRLRAEQAKAAEEQLRGQSDQAVGALQGQRLQVERAGAVSPDQSVQAKIRTQTELRDIDAQIIAEQESFNERLAAMKLQAASGDTSNAAYQAQVLANVKFEEQAKQKLYADDTKILQETQQQYTTFFNSIEQGWAKAITNMLTEHKKFSTEVVSIEKQLTASFTQMVLKRVTTWIEGTALIQAAERSFNLILQALHLEQFTQTATQTAALATIQNSALAESVAAQKAADEADVISSAGAGAAAAAAEAAPLGPEAAAAAGIAVGSEILALGQFEIGGIVPGHGPVPIMAHGGEKVIDSKLTQMLVNVAQGGGGGGGFTNHGGINVYGSSGNGREQGGDIMRSIDSHVRRSNLRMA